MFYRPVFVLTMALAMQILQSPVGRADGLDEDVDCGHARRRFGTGGAFDPWDGSDARNYPPHVPVDFRHLRLKIHFGDLRDKTFDAEATLTLRAVRSDLTILKLNAVDLFIDRVVDGSGHPLRFDYDTEQLILYFDEALKTDADTTVTIHYRCVDPQEGMYFAIPDAAYSHRPLVVHTQGETETSRYWFPCLDYPGDRLTTEVIATVPRPFFALSNGRLIDVIQDNANKQTTYHWKQSVPHVFYLVSLVVGQFDVVGDKWRNIPINYYVPLGRADDARRTYERTPKMIDFFSKVTGVDYPYEKYAQVNVPLFLFGGMENTTATTMNDRALLDVRAAIDNDHDGVISHELAHQWYGDLITCRSWPHVWLNEGFATFFASLWREEQFGRQEYLYEFRRRFGGVVAADRTDIPGAIVFAEYSHSFEPFFHKGALAYSKGSCVLHMLRHQLGDELFFKGIQTYTRRYRESLVETDDLRHVFEEVTGRNFEQFFEQWVYRPGVPHLEVSYHWHPKKKLAVVSIKQTQHIDADTPAFSFPLDLVFRSDGEFVKGTVNVSTRNDSYTRRFDVKPDMLCVDPQLGLLMKLTCEKPRPMWVTQLQEGPTSIARIVAAENLAKFDRPDVVDALRAVLGEQETHWSVRSEAAGALGAMQSLRALKALIDAMSGSGISDPKTRRATVAALGQYNDAKAAEILTAIARSDASYSVEAAATEALGNMHGHDVVPTLLENVNKSSHFDVIRTAALNALAKLNAREGIAVAKQYARYGHHERLRAEAIGVLGRLAHREQDRGDIREFLINLLNDSQVWSRWAAIDALAEIGDAESRAAIEKRLAGFTKSRTRQTAEAALKRIDDAQSKPSPVKELQTEVNDLRDKIEKLEEQINEIEKSVPAAER